MDKNRIYKNHIIMNNLKSYAMALMALLLVVGTVSAATFSTCTTITSPGVYQQTAPIDFTGPAGYACIDIQSSDVIIDGNGFSISNTGLTNTGIHIKAATGALDNITIKNMELNGDGEADIFIRANNTKIYNNTIYGFYNRTVGIYALGQQTSGNYEYFNISIYNNTIRDFNDTATGVVVSQYANVYFYNNTLYNFGNNISGVYNGGRSYGFLGDSVSLNQTVVDGFSVSGGFLANVTIENNNIYNLFNYSIGLVATVSYGDMNVRFNTIQDLYNHSTGMQIKPTSGGNVVVNNNTVRGCFDGYGCDMVILNGADYLFTNNTISDFTGVAGYNSFGLYVSGVRITVDNNELKNFSTSNGIYFVGDNNIYTNNKIHSFYTPSPFSGVQFHSENSNVTFQNNQLYNYSGSATRAGITVTGDDLYILDNNITNATGGGIYLILNNPALDNVTIARNRIYNMSQGWGVYSYILNSQSNVTIEENNITLLYDFSGIIISGGNSTVRNNRITDVVNSIYGGIYVLGTPNGTTIYDNLIQNSSIGIYVAVAPVSDIFTIRNNNITNVTEGVSGYGYNLRLHSNIISDFTSKGISLFNYEPLDIWNNTVTTTTDGASTVFGIQLNTVNYNVNVTNNTINIINTSATTSTYGIDLVDVISADVINNTVESAYYGIRLSGNSDGNNISDNYLCGASIAIVIEVGSDGNTGVNNHGNTIQDLGSSNTISIINDCSGSPILTTCTVITNDNNRDYTLGDYLAGSPNSRPYGNACLVIENSNNINVDCLGFGFVEVSPTYDTIAIDIYNSTNIHIDGCSISNYGQPIRVSGTATGMSDNIVVNNTIIDLIRYGIFVDYATNVVMDNAMIYSAEKVLTTFGNGFDFTMNNSDITPTDFGGTQFMFATTTSASPVYVGNVNLENIRVGGPGVVNYDDVFYMASNFQGISTLKNIVINGKWLTPVYSYQSSFVSADNITADDVMQAFVTDDSPAAVYNSQFTYGQIGIFGTRRSAYTLENITLIDNGAKTAELVMDNQLYGPFTLNLVKNITLIDSRGSPTISINPNVFPALNAAEQILAIVGPALFGETIPAPAPGYSEVNGKIVGIFNMMNISNFQIYYSDSDIPSGVSETAIKAMWFDGSSWTEIPHTVDTVNNIVNINLIDTSMQNFNITDATNTSYPVALVGLFYLTEVTPNFNVTGDVIFQVIFTGDNYAANYDVILQKRDDFGSYYVVGNGTTGIDGVTAFNLSYNETVPQVFRVSIYDDNGVLVYEQDRFVSDFNVIVLTPSFTFLDMMKQALLLGQNLLILILGIILISMHLFGWTKGLAVGSFFSSIFLLGISYALDITIQQIWYVWLVALIAMAVGASVFLRRFDV